MPRVVMHAQKLTANVKINLLLRSTATCTANTTTQEIPTYTASDTHSTSHKKVVTIKCVNNFASNVTFVYLKHSGNSYRNTA